MTTTDTYRMSALGVAGLLDLNLEACQAEALRIAERLGAIRQSLELDLEGESYSAPGFNRALVISRVLAFDLRDLADQVQGSQRLQERMPW